MSVRIILETTTNLPETEKEKFIILPLRLRFGQEEYIDGVDITDREFYERLPASKELPTTSQASPYEFEELLRPLVAAGDTALILTLSSGLSGTYQSACIAAAEFGDSVRVVESRSVAIGTGILAQYARRLADMGLGVGEIAEALEVQRERIGIFATLNTLEYLHRGGRISKSVAIAGGVLGIKPVVSMKEGKVALVGTARGAKQGSARLAKEMERGMDRDMPWLLGYTGTEDSHLQNFIAAYPALWEGDTPPQAVIGSVVGCHVGPGAVCVAFFEK